MEEFNLSIIIPVFNEVDNIEPLLARIDNSLYNNLNRYEIIFIDDKSTDGTVTKIRECSFGRNIKILSKKGKKGKAYSLLEGFKEAKGDIVVMIDADLQYPPEAIPEMIRCLDNADIIVTDRLYLNNKFRQIFSKTFKFIFGKTLFGLDCDVQSGLKAFRKEVLDIVKFTPCSAWTFDLEFLHRANQAGFRIVSTEINFSPRKNGVSKINFLNTVFELGFNAFILRFKYLNPVEIPSKTSDSMIGAGIIHKRKTLITHTTLHHSHSAMITFEQWQIILLYFILLLFIFGLFINFTLTVILAIGILTIIYFTDVIFNLYVILKSLYFPPEFTFTENEVSDLNDDYLPVYSILSPLYKETRILPEFIKSIENLDWPKEKLDVLLLLEEDDKQTIKAVSALKLPFYFRIIIVPNSSPKTKPKACNYGLGQAKGEYLVIFDAEDKPDPDQLKKAYLGFHNAPANIVCLQAKLNYFNPHQNLLTRLFTAEYSLWFDIVLGGLQSINTTIPLGGTSNHFKTKVVKDLEGWDPFNVTEDCDLGVRIFKKGFQTAIINSTTWEEANSDIKNWVRQRSRWIKGYLQTYLVHNRRPIQFIKKNGIHAFIFQLIIGARMSFMLINPILWLLTLSYFALYSLVGPTIETFYPAPVLYMAVFSLVAGNFMYVYEYMIGAAKRRQWNLIKFIYLIPFYWFLASIAAFIAVYQLIVKPHYWEKTIHGLHLKEEKIKEFVEQAVIDEEKIIENNMPFHGFSEWIRVTVKNRLSFNKNRKLFVGGILLVGLTMMANLLNFAFSVYLGRSLGLEAFGELSLFTSLLYFISIPLGNFSGTISHEIAYLYGKFSKDYARGYLEFIFDRSVMFGVFLTFTWVTFTPFLSSFFHTKSYAPILIFAPLFIISFISSNYSGYMAGVLSFGKKGIILATEAVTRLIFAYILVQAGFSNLVYFSIFLSLSISAILSWLLIRKDPVGQVKTINKKFNIVFFLMSTLSGFSLIAFLTLDVILVKHFLSPVEAGRYGLLALIGKMTYFFGSLFGPFMIPLVSHNEGANKNSKKTFGFLFVITAVFSLISFIALGLLGKYIVPLIFGSKSLNILHLLIPYVLAMAYFTMSQPIASFFQAKKNYSYALVGFFVSVFQIITMSVFHKSLEQVVMVMLLTSVVNLTMMLFLYFMQEELLIISSNIKNFIAFILTKNKTTQNAYFNPRILIFNWRDTKHKWSGGAEVYVHEIAKRWVKNGHDVTVFCGNSLPGSKSEVVDGVEVIRVGGFYLVYLWAFIYYIFKFRGKYDIVIDCENGIPFFTPLYSRKPIFLLIHHVHQDVFRKSLKRPMAILASFLETKLMPFVYRNTQILTVSPSSRDEIMKYKLTKKEPIVIYNGVDLTKFKPGIKDPKPTILYLGRLQYYKSLDVFIKAAKKVLKQVPDAEFLIAGEGVERRQLVGLAKKLKILKKVKFLGKVTEEIKIQLYQRAWIFINPSFMEGWGLTTIEANACGTPTIASKVPGLKDSIKDMQTGILVPYGDHKAFSDSILMLIKNNALRAKLSEEAIKWSGNFTWDKSSEDLYSLIDKKVKENFEKRLMKNRFFDFLNRFTFIFDLWKI